MDFRLFNTVLIRDPCNFSSNSFDLHALLLRRPTWCHVWYLQGLRNFPLRFLQMGPLRQVNARLQDLKALEAPPPPCAHAPRPQWMSSYSICLINTCFTLRRCPNHNRNQSHTLMQYIRRSLSMDSYRQVEASVEEIGACLETCQDRPLYLQGACAVLKRWY